MPRVVPELINVRNFIILRVVPEFINTVNFTMYFTNTWFSYFSYLHTLHTLMLALLMAESGFQACFGIFSKLSNLCIYC